jgi:hypothetical protein
VDLGAHEWFERDLLVLTGPHLFSHDVLGLPFRDATVVQANGEHDAEIAGSFDTVVVDQGSFDRTSVNAALARAARVLRADGRVVVVFPPANRDVATFHAPPAARDPTGRLAPQSDAQSGLAWRGVGDLNGRLCAVLAPVGVSDGPAAPIAALLEAAHASFRLGVERAANEYADARRRLRHVEASLAQHIEETRRSEQALLRHLEVLVKELNEERRKHRGRALVHTVLNRHKTGRAVVRVLRPLWQVLRKLRHGARALKRRLASARGRSRSART